MFSPANFKINYLVARVVASHVALATIDAHVRVDQRHHVLLIVQIAVLADVW